MEPRRSGAATSLASADGRPEVTRHDFWRGTQGAEPWPGSQFDRNKIVRDRYEATGQEVRSDENLLGIKNKAELDRVENIALKQAEDLFFRKLVSKNHRFTATDICNMHKVWLGKIYEWAGKYRSVDLIKGIRFAHARHIPSLMEDFEKRILSRHTPCVFNSRKRVVEALAEVHNELVLIHPFREGNGRLARLLSTLMALQAGLPQLDFSPIEKGKGKQKYFNAVQAGLAKDYQLMQEIFEKVIEKTLSRSHGKNKSG